MFAGLGETVEGYRVSFWGNRNVLRLIWKWIYNFAYTRCHWIVHFKCVNCMVGELYLNEAVLCCWFFFNRHIWRTDVAKRQGHGGRMDCEFRISRCKMLYIEWINNKVLLYSTENYILYPVINHNGKEFF